MEFLKNSSEIINSLFEVRPSNCSLKVLDIGCAGGPDHIFELIDEKLKVDYLGIDCIEMEINRLKNLFVHKNNFHFEAKYLNSIYKTEVRNSFFPETSAAFANNYVNLENKNYDFNLSNNSLKSNLGNILRVSMPELLKNFEIKELDLLKIDVDGPDFSILVDTNVATLQPKFIVIEVNYQGDNENDTNTFHNIDRYLKSFGYELGGLTVRKYSSGLFPRDFEFDIFAQTKFGRPLQGEALYFLKSKIFTETDVQNVFKSTLLFDSFNLEDQAVELLLKTNAKIPSQKLEKILDNITTSVYNNKYKNYKDLVSTFKSNPEVFFPEKTKLETIAINEINNYRIKDLVQTIIKKLVKKILLKSN